MKIVLTLVALILLVGGGLMFYQQSKIDRDVAQRLHDIETKRDQILKLDSLRVVIEQRIVDSLGVEFKKQGDKINRLETEQKKIQKQNAELQKRYDSLSVSLPEF